VLKQADMVLLKFLFQIIALYVLFVFVRTVFRVGLMIYRANKLAKQGAGQTGAAESGRSKGAGRKRKGQDKVFDAEYRVVDED
jgi:UPF0716 family protein affecting phage T7 exclusion